jgi:catechol 2,3-dioxygenase-like lactoylglutathione lyase family enzyme
MTTHAPAPPAPNRTPEGATSVIKFHAALNVSDLERSVAFYTALLGVGPAKCYPDYAKFETDEPPLVLSLKPKRACAGGPLNHLGLRLVRVEQLRVLQQRLKAVGARIGQQDDVQCCYARQTKLWVTDPDETLWEVYVWHEDVPDWGEKHRKVKLLAAPFRAFGLVGLIRRAWNNPSGGGPPPVPPERCPAPRTRRQPSRPMPAPAVDPRRSRPVPSTRRAGVVPQPGLREGAALPPKGGCPADACAVGSGSNLSAYWLGLPFRWAWQMAHNGLGILRVLDLTHLRPLPPGLIRLDHPWATGINPDTGRLVWHQNVVYRSARGPADVVLPPDEEVLTKTCRFLAEKAALSAVVPAIPQGPRRRMPHGINYIHGSSHYNSGIFVFTDFADALAHFTDPRFRAEVWRFVGEERREVLILLRRKGYTPWEFACFTCCLRTLFPWFCNANGPQGRVLWGNAAPFPAANLIAGNWACDVYALKRPGGAAAVVRPPVQAGAYFRGGPYGRGRRHYRWPERLLARVTYWRVRLRGGRGGMFFVDRRRVYADQIEGRRRLGLPDEPVARM